MDDTEKSMRWRTEDRLRTDESVRTQRDRVRMWRLTLCAHPEQGTC